MTWWARYAVPLLALSALPLSAAPPEAEDQATVVVVVELEEDRAPSDAETGEGEAADQPLSGTLVARPAGSAISDVEPTRVRLSIPGTARLSLPTAGRWRVHFEGDGVWIPDASVEPRTGGTLLLPAFRTGRVVGALRGSHESEPAGEIELRGRLLRRHNRGSHEGVTGSVACTVAPSGRFECPLPWGIVDLRLEPTGWAHEVVWNLEVRPRQTVAAGEVALRRGAELSGVLLAEETGEPITGAEVRLAPSALGELRLAEAQRFELAGAATESSEDGFTFTSIAPGSYDLTAAKAGRSPAALSGVRLSAGTATRLPEPVLMARPAALEVFLTPPLPPNAERWRLFLLRQTQSGGVELVDSETPEAGPGGYWLATGLRPGPYRLHVGTSRSPRWLAEDLELEAGLNTVQREIGAVRIEGELLAGDEPVEAVLWFGGRSGHPSIRIPTDGDGRFEGVLPREGEWRLDVSDGAGDDLRRIPPVLVERTSDGEPVFLTVELPGGALRGLVVDSTGEPVEDAVVEALNIGDRRLEGATHSDEDGEFELLGLESGSFYVEASTVQGHSPPRLVEVVEDEEADRVTLVLDEAREVEGLVRTASGPVAGAKMIAVPVRSTPGPVEVLSLVTGADGRFTARVPEGTTHLRALVHGAGHPLTATTFALPAPSEEIRVVLPSSGGTLLLATGGDEAPGSPVLIHGGTAFPLSVYRRAAAPGAVASRGEEGGRLRNVAPGDYTLCVSANPSRQGGTGASPTCVSGYLGPGGTLSLDVRDE